MRERIEAAIAAVEESRRTHVLWVEWYEARPSCRNSECGHNTLDVTLIGDIDFHRACVARYDEVIATLRAEDEPPLDCRSPEGEAVGMVDAAIHTLRAASRADTSHPAVQAALQDLLADPEISELLWSGAPCKGQNVNICVAEGCYGRACLKVEK